MEEIGMNVQRIPRPDRPPLLSLAIAALALAMGGAWGSAHAATSPEMAACARLPSSERGICQQKAGYGQPDMQKPRTPAQQQAIDRESARYKQAAAACKRLSSSERTTCMSRAGDDVALAAGQ
jgi:hypothetical protein